MALNSKEKLLQNGKYFKKKLEALGCPYTEDVEESWVIDLLFKPGEHRIRLLQWLFCKFDSRLHDILDPQTVVTDAKMDSRIQRLLYVASSLGLCSMDDAELIRGGSSVSKQTAFLTQLLDIVSIIDKSEDPKLQSFNSPGFVCEGQSLTEQYQRDCEFVDVLAAEERMDSVLSSEARLLPPHLIRQLQVTSGAGKTVQIPDTSNLKEMAVELTASLEKREHVLADLKKSQQYEEDDSQSHEKILRTLKLVLSELSQILVGFSYCFENELRQWCSRDPPELLGLGPAFSRIQKLLQHFVQILDGVGVVRSSHKRMYLHLPEQFKSLSEYQSKGTTLPRMEEFRTFVSVLEESLTRGDKASYSTDTTNVSLNSTFLSNVVKLD